MAVIIPENHGGLDLRRSFFQSRLWGYFGAILGLKKGRFFFEYWQFVPVSQFPMENHLQLSKIIDLNLSKVGHP